MCQVSIGGAWCSVGECADEVGQFGPGAVERDGDLTSFLAVGAGFRGGFGDRGDVVGDGGLCFTDRRPSWMAWDLRFGVPYMSTTVAVCGYGAWAPRGSGPRGAQAWRCYRCGSGQG
jgi:hypothetical protein